MVSINPSIIVDKYSKALYAVAGNSLRAEVEDWKKAFESKAIRDFYSNLAISTNFKKETIRTSNANKLLKSFLLILLENKRTSLIIPCLGRYLQIIKDSEGEAVVIITTTIPLSIEEQNNILATFANQLKIKADNLTANNVIDSTIIGGFIIKINNIVVDYSIKGQLEKFITLSKEAISKI